jgi:flagellin-like hook-associated protein FlgL
MADSMSDTEVKAIRWVEHVLAPLIVAAILILSTCANQTTEAVTELKTEQSHSKEDRLETQAAIKAIETDLNAIKVDNGKMSANQEHFKTQIEKIQTTQEETNRLLRGLQ